MPHINEKIDYTVEVFIVFENKVLLRKHDKYKIWLSVGGHIEPDEDPNQAAIREVKEEVGLDIKLDESLREYNPTEEEFIELIPPYFLNRHRVSKTHEHVTLVYFAKSTTDKITQQNNHEKSEECKWFTKQDLEKEDIVSNVKFYASKALNKLSPKILD